MSSMDKLLLTPREVAQLTGISPNTIRDYCKNKTNGFPSFNRGRDYKIPRTSLEKWCEEQAERRAEI